MSAAMQCQSGHSRPAWRSSTLQDKPVESSPRTKIVLNGHAQTNLGYRQVVLSPMGVVRPVFSAQYTGHRHERCTRQSAKEGDFVLRFDWYPERWTLFKVHAGELVKQNRHQFSVAKPVLAKLPKEMDEWFLDRTVWESFLPAGCGWDGVKTVSQMRKELHISELFQGLDEPDWLAGIRSDAEISPAVGLPYRWDTAEHLPAYLDSPALRHVCLDARNNLDEYTEWVLFYSDGDVEMVRIAPTSGHYSNEMSEVTTTYSNLQQSMPIDCVKAIRVSRGCYNKGHGSYGVKWTLYKA